jgi:hypothetical protein|tara:strand:- start:4648 stop:4884 length:237 start_codon:yes stop_codon:yes gene_type:complete
MITRSGRKIKKPELFVPTEKDIVDDYSAEEHDTDFDSELDTEDEEDYSSEEGDEDADENGNLKDFIVDDASESESEDA